MKLKIKQIMLGAMSIFALASCGSMGEEISFEEFKTKAEALPSRESASFTSASLTGKYKMDVTMAGESDSESVDLKMSFTVSEGVLSLSKDDTNYKKLESSKSSVEQLVERTLSLKPIDMTLDAVVNLESTTYKYFDQGDNKLGLSASSNAISGINGELSYSWDEYGFMTSFKEEDKFDSDSYKYTSLIEIKLTYSK